MPKVICCPRCGSSKLKRASGLPYFWSLYECQECWCRGSLIIEDGELARKIRKQWLEKQREKG